jgi:hypothetical protein
MRSSRPDAGRDGRGGAPRFFLLVWVLLATAGCAWAVATPLFASPDEDAQVVKAVAVAHGQLTGETTLQPGEYFPVMTSVEVPEYYATARSTTQCFIWDTLQPADCAPAFRADDGTGEVDTWFGRYPPLYYGVVGLPSRFLDGEAAVLAMRGAGAVLCAGLLALGFTALRTTRHPTALMGAGLIGVTPTVLFLAGMVNPSGLEIAAGFALWCVLLPLVLDPGAHRPGPRLLAGAAVAAVLVNTRPGSALMAVLIGIPLVLLTTRGFWRDLWRSGALRLPLVVCAVGGAAAAAWLLVQDPTASLGGDPDPSLASPTAAVAEAVGMSGRYLREQVAVFGWLNLFPHPLVLGLLGTAVVALVAAAVVLGRGRARWALVLTVVLVLAVPVVVQVPSAARLGLIWQGRYILPVSVGVPLLAMAALVDARRQRIAAVGGVVLAGVAVLGHVGAFGWSAWRYAWGFGRSPLAGPPSWEPPGGIVLWLALFAAATVATGLVCVLQGDSPARRFVPGRRRMPSGPEPVAHAAP